MRSLILKWAWQVQFLSHTLQILGKVIFLKIYKWCYHHLWKFTFLQKLEKTYLNHLPRYGGVFDHTPSHPKKRKIVKQLFSLRGWGRTCTKFYEPLLVAHILKFLPLLRVLALPKQCDDDVASVVGLNCPKLECIILTGTSVTNVGLSWLLCCRQLHTLIMPGFFQGVTPKGNYSMHFVHYFKERKAQGRL